jgi:type IV pilus assembly protein PilW
MRATARQRGFTLVEVMISTVVALFATLAIMQSFAVSEGYRRTSTSGGDATFSGAVGMYVMERDLQVAGYGINTSTYLGCATSGTDELVAPGRAINFTLAPAQITPGVNAATPDTITLISSSTGWLPAPINLTTAMASPTSNYQVNNPFGVTAGDVLVLAQSGQACTVVQATNTPTTGTPGNQNTVLHASGTFRTSGGGTALARYNPAGGIGPVYSASAVLMDVGAAPAVNTYYILNNTLTVDQLVTGQLAQPVAANIVQLKALYGKDTNGDGIVDTWNTTAPVTSSDWASVLAVRVALVARSAQPEKPDPTTGVCSTTTVAPTVTWDDGTTTQLILTANANWQCYRYKVFHMTTSLRNLIWTPS